MIWISGFRLLFSFFSVSPSLPIFLATILLLLPCYFIGVFTLIYLHWSLKTRYKRSITTAYEAAKRQIDRKKIWTM